MIKLDSNEKAYREWLISKLNCIKDRSYKKLLRALYSIEFYALIPNDEDRAKDGVRIRNEWSEIHEDDVDILFGPCKMLEFLIGMAIQTEMQIFASKWIDEWNFIKIFWMFIENLGLSEFCDKNFVTCDKFYEKIVTKCDGFCDRKYTCDGFGGIFPVKNAGKDMRKLNLWAQMGIFVRNKWPI